MKQSPSWESSSSSSNQKILRNVWNPNVHYRIHKNPPNAPYPEPEQTKSQTPPSYLLKIHFKNILLFTPRSSK
jgi:hypothetical protein